MDQDILAENEYISKRLRDVCGDFGWGYLGEAPEFWNATKLGYDGWKLGNGIVVTPWHGKKVPTDPVQALEDIERYCNEDRKSAGMPLLPLD